MRVGFVLIAMALSLFVGRLVQLQGVDPNSYAQMAAAEGMVDVVLPANRGNIVDRNGEPLADSVDGLMIAADPKYTHTDAARLATFLSKRLDIDYFETLDKLRATDSEGNYLRFAYVARQVPASTATDVVKAAEDRDFAGLFTRRDPVRSYPGHQVAANLVGFLGTPDTDGTTEPLAGLESSFNRYLAGTDGKARYQVGAGAKIPLGDNTVTKAVDGQDLHTTIDRDLQWYAQGVLRQTVVNARGDSGHLIVMDSRTGELMAMADYPTYDADDPESAVVPAALDTGDEEDSRQQLYKPATLTDPYEPGSVEKVLTMSSLIDAGKVTPRTKFKVPSELNRQDATIHDYFEHGTIRLTLAGILAKSSNIGTVRAADQFEPGQLRDYLVKFGLGERTDIGLSGETRGILPSGSLWTSQTADRIAFGQGLSVNAVQMTAAVNTIANGGVRVDPSVVDGKATLDDGTVVGSDVATRHRVVSAQAAQDTARMMERVVDPDAGVAPGAQVPGYRVAGKTGTAQRVGAECGCYDGTFTVSFAGFAPAEDPRFTIYVVVQNPRNGGGGGSIAGPAFSKMMGYTLSRYSIEPSTTKPSQLPVEW